MTDIRRPRLTRESLEIKVNTRAEATNMAEIARNRQILSRIDQLLAILEKFRVPVARITTSDKRIDEVMDLQDLIRQVQEKLNLLKNILFTSISPDKDGEIKRTGQNIASLRSSVHNGIKSLSEIHISADSKLQDPPDITANTRLSPSQLMEAMQQLDSFLSTFIESNRFKIFIDNKTTIGHLEVSAKQLKILEVRNARLEKTAVGSADALDIEWADLLAQLVFAISDFELRLMAIYRQNANSLLASFDKKTLREKSEAAINEEARLKETIDKKDRLAALPFVKFFMQLLNWLQRKPVSLPLSSPERLALKNIQQRLKKYAVISRLFKSAKSQNNQQ